MTTFRCHLDTRSKLQSQRLKARSLLGVISVVVLVKRKVSFSLNARIYSQNRRYGGKRGRRELVRLDKAEEVTERGFANRKIIVRRKKQLWMAISKKVKIFR